MGGLSDEIQVIQRGDDSSAAPPLFLIHDAGGTVLNYYSLGNLGRTVYGIPNPRFDSGEPWKGGVMEMAQTYYAWIKRCRPQGGDILLGGWSFGGMLAVQLAYILARDPAFRVRGILMLDCPFPHHYAPGAAIVMPPPPPGMSAHVQTNLETAVRHAVDLLRVWRVPRWVTPRMGTPPATVMLFARERVPMPEEGEVAMVDNLRSDETLGWKDCGVDLLRKTIEVPGNHFSIFLPENVDALTEKIKEACSLIESGSLDTKGAD